MKKTSVFYFCLLHHNSARLIPRFLFHLNAVLLNLPIIKLKERELWEKEYANKEIIHVAKDKELG